MVALLAREHAVVRWGILGPGTIARQFSRGLEDLTSGKLVAIATRSAPKPDLRVAFPHAKIHVGYDRLLADSNVDAVYISTPHPFHAEWAIKAADAGKHVLCEKPASMNEADTRAMFAAATRNGTFMGEAYMYRQHPLTTLILDLLGAGKIGELRLIRSSFGFATPPLSPDHRLINPALGGGAILDVGGYPMSMARLLAGRTESRDDMEPAALDARILRGATGVDEIATATVTFDNGIIAQLSASIALEQDNVLHLMGTAGRLEVDAFWFCTGKEGGTSRIRFWPIDGPCEVISCTEQRQLYGFQIDAANEAIRQGLTRFNYPGMTEADSIANARSLDRWITGAEG